MMPRMKAGEPTGNVAAVKLVVGSEQAPESRFFVEMNKEDDGEGRDDSDDQGASAGATEYDPQANPAGEEADVHGIADVAVEADDHKSLRRGEGRGCATAGPAKIPDTAKCHSEAENRRNGRQPAPEIGRAHV